MYLAFAPSFLITHQAQRELRPFAIRAIYCLSSPQVKRLHSAYFSRPYQWVVERTPRSAPSSSVESTNLYARQKCTFSRAANDTGIYKTYQKICVQPCSIRYKQRSPPLFRLGKKSEFYRGKCSFFHLSRSPRQYFKDITFSFFRANSHDNWVKMTIASRHLPNFRRHLEKIAPRQPLNRLSFTTAMAYKLAINNNEN